MRKYSYFLFFQFCHLVEKLIAPLIWFTKLGKKAGNGSLMFSNFTKVNSKHIVKWFARPRKYPENNRGWALLKRRAWNSCVSAQHQAIILLFGQIKTEHVAPYLNQQQISHNLLLCTLWMLWGEPPCLKTQKKMTGVLGVLKSFL